MTSSPEIAGNQEIQPHLFRAVATDRNSPELDDEEVGHLLPKAQTADWRLKSGSFSRSDVPIEYIHRDGNTLILSTRSAKALERAGIPRPQWKGVNRTGNAAERRLTDQLRRNKLTNKGTTAVKPRKQKATQ